MNIYILTSQSFLYVQEYSKMVHKNFLRVLNFHTGIHIGVLCWLTGCFFCNVCTIWELPFGLGCITRATFQTECPALKSPHKPVLLLGACTQHYASCFHRSKINETSTTFSRNKSDEKHQNLDCILVFCQIVHVLCHSSNVSIST